MTEKKKNRNTRAHIDGNNRYSKKAYDRISLIVPKGDKAKIKAVADSKGESVNGYISTAIKRRIESGD